MTDYWCLLGDFNAVLRDHERQGGSNTASVRGDRAFRELVEDCNLVDLGFQGAPFTWNRGQLQERLDRGLANMDWCLLFSEATIVHLHPLKSDHCPLLLRMTYDRFSFSSRRPFRFESAWLTYENFADLVKAKWNVVVGWNDKIDHMQGCLKNWNKSIFGNIFFQKRRIIRRLNGILLKLQEGPNKYFEKLQLDLWSEYENILVREELLWFQKSRCKWLCLGDRNTKYFHGTTVIRRRRNKVEMLQDESGRWVSDKAELEGLVTNFYKDLFQDIDPYTPFNLTGYFPEVHDSLMQNLGRDITEDEIFGAIRRMGSFKAPGPDGFQPIFYQT
ncbi:uncharacterized protein LOC109818683 [Cajanus cajan]|uniref:uncharacterized protein LOC109818683 n=1 Tax=Cajanus cajan TaxID=3821 RepID=UPI00098DB245|nr:uncharacterized protein LOC109818683 [Cajanus cajan]